MQFQTHNIYFFPPKDSLSAVFKIFPLHIPHKKMQKKAHTRRRYKVLSARSHKSCLKEGSLFTFFFFFHTPAASDGKTNKSHRHTESSSLSRHSEKRVLFGNPALRARILCSGRSIALMWKVVLIGCYWRQATSRDVPLQKEEIICWFRRIRVGNIWIEDTHTRLQGDYRVWPEALQKINPLCTLNTKYIIL